MRIEVIIHRNGFGLKVAACLAVSLLAGIGCRSQEIAVRQAARRDSTRDMFAYFRTLEKRRPASIEKVFSEWERLRLKRNISLENPPNLFELNSMGVGKAPVEK